MTEKEAFKTLRKKFPNKEIIVQKSNGKIKKLIVDIDPTDLHPEWSRVISVIFDSEIHKHYKTMEIYTVLKGELKLYVEDKVIILKEGEAYGILPNQLHNAESNAKGGVLIACYMTPGWVPEDHIVVSL